MINATRFVAALVLGVVLVWAPAASAAVFSVTTTADSGPGSLRQAVEDANSNAGGDSINFAIPEDQCQASGVCAIELVSDLPEITDGVIVDGTTQQRYGSAPANVCSTGNAPAFMRVQVTGEVEYVFQLTGPGSTTIRGLALGEALDPIRADDGATATVQCNIFGLSGDGVEQFRYANGVCLGCSSRMAGGALIGTDGDGVDDVSEGNVFADGAVGVNVNTGNNVVIAGNLFGLHPDGVERRDLLSAVYIRQSASNNRVGSNDDGISDDLERNVFGYSRRGVWIDSRAQYGDGNRVVGNWIGVNAQGEPGAVDEGVRLSNEGLDHVVSRNRIEAADVGILVQGGSSLSTSSTDNCIVGNDVGLRHEGTATGLAAALNWWGDSSGPSGLGDGAGDSIEIVGDGTVDFEPWLTSPGAACRGTTELIRIVVPAAAAAPGEGDSFFVTDVEVNNRGGSAETFVVLWLPRNTDNTNPATSDAYTLEPGASVRFANVLESVFGLGQGAGALVIESESPSLSVMSRTFNRGSAGTFGQSLPGVPEAHLVQSGQRVRILFMSENADYRSNLGLVNGNERPVSVQYRLYDTSGTLLGEGQRWLEAWGNTQVNRVFAPYEPQEAAYVDVWTDTPDGTFTCYGSVLDNQTSDPTTVPAE